MNKKGLILKIILIVIAVVVILAAVGAFYLYNYHVFKTVRVCVSQEVTDLPVNCTDDEICVTLLSESLVDLQEAKEDAPDFIKPKIDEVLDMAIYCEGTCKVREVYGMGLGGKDDLDFCEAGDIEIKQDIRGKEAIEFAKFMKEGLKGTAFE